MNLQASVALLLGSAAFGCWYLGARHGRRLTVTLMLYALLLLLHAVPLLVYLFFTGPDTFIYEAAMEGVPPDVVRSKLLLAITASLLCVPLGIELASATFNRRWQRARRVLKAQPPGQLYRTLYLSQLMRTVLWATALAMLAVSVLESQPGKVLQYFAFGESELGRLLLRREGGGTPYYLYNVVLYAVAPYLFMVAWRADKARHNFPLLAIALFAAVMLGKFGTLSKAPPVIFLLQLVLLRVLVQRRPINLRAGLTIGVSALALFFVIVRLTIPDLDLASAGAFLYYRVFDIPNEGLLEYFAAIPYTLPHGWGAGILSLLRDGSAADYVPAYSAVAEVTRNSLDSTSNVMFVGDAWAEFGWAGVVVFSVSAGFVVRSIDIFALRDGESDSSACLIAGCSFGVFTALSTALNTGLITGGLALLPLIAIGFRRRRHRPASAEALQPASA